MCTDLHQFWYNGSYRGHSQLWQFYGSPWKGVNSAEDQNSPFPIVRMTRLYGAGATVHSW